MLGEFSRKLACCDVQLSYLTVWLQLCGLPLSRPLYVLQCMEPRKVDLEDTGWLLKSHQHITVKPTHNSRSYNEHSVTMNERGLTVTACMRQWYFVSDIMN